MPDDCVTVEVDADTDGAEDAISEVTAAVEDLAAALEDVDAALRRIDSREFSLSIELQPRSATDTGDAEADRNPDSDQ